MVDTRIVYFTATDTQRNTAILGTRFSAISSLAITLIREISNADNSARLAAPLSQHAVDAKRTTKRFS